MAKDFRPPSFSQVAGWGFGIGPWIAQSWLQLRAQIRLDDIKAEAQGTRSTRNQVRVAWASIMCVVHLIIAWLIGFVALPLMLLLTVAAVLPPLRRVVSAVQLGLAQSLGDSYVLVTSPVRFNAMVSQVQHDLQWLVKRKCKNIVVVAHSQGAAVAFEAVRGENTNQADLDAPKADYEWGRRLKLFVTYGAGISKLELVRTMLKREATIRFVVLLRGVGILLLLTCVAWEATLFGSTIIEWSRGSYLGVNTITRAILGVILLVAAFVLDKMRIKPVTQILTREDPKETLKREGCQWRDYYASKDPVPNLALLRASSCGVSKEIYNRHSLIQDHVAYWENPEEFVGELAHEMAAVSDPRFERVMEDRNMLDFAQAKRRYRVDALRDSTRTTFAVLILAGLWLGVPGLFELGQRIAAAAGWALAVLPVGLPGDIGSALSNRWVSLLLGGSAMVAAAVLWQRWVVFLLWRAWDKRDASRLFERTIGEVHVRSAVWFLASWALMPIGTLGLLLALTWLGDSTPSRPVLWTCLSVLVLVGILEAIAGTLRRASSREKADIPRAPDASSARSAQV